MSSARSSEYEGEPGASLPRWAAIVLIIIVVVVVYVAYTQSDTRADLREQWKKTQDQLARLEARTATLEAQYANLRGQVDVTSQRLGLTQKELEQARAVASQIKQEQQKAVAAIDTRLDTLRAKQEAEVGVLTGEVTTVKGDVEATKRSLADTQTKLERAIGDLGVQSGLIAKNSTELGELRRRGDRNYIEFELPKSKEFTRYGGVSLRLNKTDPKRQKYTLTLLANDKLTEKKDKTLLEPVQFYLAGTRHMLEIVVYDISRDRISGYLSAPKELAAR